MNCAIFRKQEWLNLLAALLAGLLFATTVGGQESVLQQVVVEELPCETNSTTFQGQVAITSHVRGRFEPVCIFPQDEVWLISARDSHCAPSDLSLLRCSRLKNGNWQTAELEELVQLHSTDKTKVTMLYVHGNRTALKWASSRGLQFYKSAFQTEKRPPIRYVIFAWRSDIERARIVPDYNIKSQRSVTIGETLAKLLGRFENRKMVIGGYSLGAQVVLTAVSNPELHRQDDGLGKFRVVIFAPALNSEFIRADLMAYPYNPIVHQTEVFFNRADCAVKISESIARRRTNSNVSAWDWACTEEITGNLITIRDITCEVNKRHSVVNYGGSTSMNTKLAELLNDTFEGCSSLCELSGGSFESEYADLNHADSEIVAPIGENAAHRLN